MENAVCYHPGTVVTSTTDGAQLRIQLRQSESSLDQNFLGLESATSDELRFRSPLLLRV